MPFIPKPPFGEEHFEKGLDICVPIIQYLFANNSYLQINISLSKAAPSGEEHFEKGLDGDNLNLF